MDKLVEQTNCSQTKWFLMYPNIYSLHMHWSTFLIDFPPFFSFFQTYNSDVQTGGSSACATAIMCGVKTNFQTVGLDARGRYENCFSSFSSRVSSLIDWAQESGKYCVCLCLVGFCLFCRFLFFFLEEVNGSGNWVWMLQKFRWGLVRTGKSGFRFLAFDGVCVTFMLCWAQL